MKEAITMPKSDTWPGGTGLETMPGIDSSGSCDSVLSANSGFSDDSLEYLSAEEKACLMFLEETIDSLDTEDDSGLSNDEPEQKPASGNVAKKQAELSAFMCRSTNDSEQKDTKPPVLKDADKNPFPSYLVPTPFVVANSSRPSALVTKPSFTSKKSSSPKPTFIPQNPDISPQLHQTEASVPIEVNVVIPPTKTQNNSSKTADSSLHRGPLSYDALVYLRKAASAKKTPLCPTVDHTIDSSPAIDNGPAQKNLSRFDRFHPEFSQSRTIPPAVPPKPKKKSDTSSTKTQNKVSSTPSFSVKRAPNPEAVRQEALQKLGLIKETNEPPSKPNIQNGSMDPAPVRYVKAQISNNNPTRSPSFCVTRLPSEPKSRGLQSSASFHHSSRHGQLNASNPVQTNRLRTEPSNHVSTEGGLKGPNSSQVASQKPSNGVGYTVMVVPGMGADRREALRKLGLLKD